MRKPYGNEMLFLAASVDFQAAWGWVREAGCTLCRNCRSGLTARLVVAKISTCRNEGFACLSRLYLHRAITSSASHRNERRSKTATVTSALRWWNWQSSSPDFWVSKAPPR